VNPLTTNKAGQIRKSKARVAVPSVIPAAADVRAGGGKGMGTGPVYA
jgi:hypothetical protein